ncbi:hypothetical protein BHE74_00059314 [Ensete ventricosum]|nr:hypothetical protein BHE74_00059314 [Ensete ventricosum]
MKCPLPGNPLDMSDMGLFRASVEGEGRRRRGREKKKENRENLDVKPFLNPDLAPPSLDDPDPRGNGEATARATEEAVSFITSYVIPRLLRRVLHRRPKTFTAFAAFFVEGRRHLRPLTSSPSSSSNTADEATSSRQRTPPF